MLPLHIRYRNSACAAFLLLAVLAWAAPARAGQHVRILGNDYKIPKIYLDEDRRPQGILVRILEHIDSLMDDYDFDIELYPWARSYNMAARGEGGIVGLSLTSERQLHFDYSEPLFTDTVAIIVLRGHEFPFRSMDDLAGKRIGIGRGGSFGDRFETMKRTGAFTVVEDDGPVLRLKKLLYDRIDCALISPKDFGLPATIRLDPVLEDHAGDLVQLPTPLLRDPNHLGFAKSMRMGPFLDRFNAVLRQEKANGHIDRIISLFFAGSVPEQ